jgi:hypothetical protein
MDDVKVAKVKEIPDCDFCKKTGGGRKAKYDGKTVFGKWAFMCEEHFYCYGIKLGTGWGQILVSAGEKDRG